MEIKEQNKDNILFFRLGDFYEMFFDDAILVSKELELTLTGKNCGLEERAPMCGVPFHSVDPYIEKLIQRGYKVAICEQVEDPKDAKGLVKREIVRIVTPGTVTSSNILDEKDNNYLASVYIGQRGSSLCYCDISTGELKITEFTSAVPETDLMNELVRIDAKEIIMNDHAARTIDTEALKRDIGVYINVFDEPYFSAEACKKTILRQFGIHTVSSLGMSDDSPCIPALGAELSYLLETQKQILSHVKYPEIYMIGDHMALDKSTIRNLEITQAMFEKTVKGSLLGVLDRTKTAMGSRTMKQWLREPLNKSASINERLDAVEYLTQDAMLRNNLRESLRPIYDFERLAGRVASGNANARDLIALRDSIFVLPDIKYDLEGIDTEMIAGIENDIDPLSDIYEAIKEAIMDDPPITLKEGGIIKEGWSDELDELNASIADARKWIAELEGKERERTGIPNLKVGYNKVFGYYLEITRSYYDNIPENYIRKQTLVNAERFITPELKEMENLVQGAETKINDLEYKAFCEIRDLVKQATGRIQRTSDAVSRLDVICSFAEVSDKMGYTRPVVDDSEEISIEKGRHPVIELTSAQGTFVSNDTYIDRSEASLLLITGPNMSGKSTYMRQTALIVLMAQSGCFVPADRAHIGVCDRIFTRIGASDNLAGGESTFYVEMSELAYILNNATERSLILLDEIGRGTSTYDGLSIAWAVCEYLLEKNRKIRTMFASHYHELTELEGRLEGFRNLNVDVAEENGEVVFLHRIVEGSASRSYGIHVAKIAGVPPVLLDRAKEKLDELESGQSGHAEDIQLRFDV